MFALMPIVIYILAGRVKKSIVIILTVIAAFFLETLSPFPFGVEVLSITVGLMAAYKACTIIGQRYVLHNVFIFLFGVWCYVFVKTIAVMVLVLGPLPGNFLTVAVRGGVMAIEYTLLLLLFLLLLLLSNSFFRVSIFNKKE
ncbi:MAG: hypothetical protein A3C80_01855 [Candidatus Ryanbacteria bacterium RIFCSPHIGHO2_02_FULL_45_43]|uniref:Uncharacterized protein n=1 Tax=Candidatus Ryanbacteria bacterium RIFCSPHIGHO2_01_45_13 TaxID=1802112 RepID=A0A1G2FY24_9BACT|nr:MAG: hypothetical protein A2718_02690 [Candidatus Ryanbacteria bacterium RIFCSPHIGHO2_01_FULL_44_130]OGZ42984.1 MAG: hypothetical protein A2W41_02630 [Candidatus Ryanbacteria bacterium RIFCSPHIGHO2_01_45_13]OGZ48689.1 MAG: hypothetical protein A3C80_01855 [Candidatus Ryanbacteria bacterium RIFCSPHIGHO2_02_FULL_45_43]OGZ50629.1 MAG: hypothetical protein A3E55_03335 [Candidatus Ryanbacteria bacterium RIFCSPHIGHO2_12_FULL_44_20]OGZ51935.1 MAG: hypothetical protein A3A17_00710 [Candidatus Ryanba